MHATRPSGGRTSHCASRRVGIYLVYTSLLPMTRRRPKPTTRAQRTPPRSASASSAEAGAARARLFSNGRSQAVRLPKAFRFPGSEVLIRHGEGNTVVLEPVPESAWPDGYWETVDDLASDLALGRVPPIGAKLLDLDPDDV